MLFLPFFSPYICWYSVCSLCMVFSVCLKSSDFFAALLDAISLDVNMTRVPSRICLFFQMLLIPFNSLIFIGLVILLFFNDTSTDMASEKMLDFLELLAGTISRAKSVADISVLYMATNEVRMHTLWNWVSLFLSYVRLIFEWMIRVYRLEHLHTCLKTGI